MHLSWYICINILIYFYFRKEDVIKKNKNVATTPVEKIAEKIIGATDIGGELKLVVKWEGIDEPELMLAKDINILYPQLVINFYAERLTWWLNKNGVQLL